MANNRTIRRRMQTAALLIAIFVPIPNLYQETWKC
jgi:hypothetical protein